jgi:hypothetical protein
MWSVITFTFSFIIIFFTGFGVMVAIATFDIAEWLTRKVLERGR